MASGLCAENPAHFNLTRLVYTHDVTAETGGQTTVMPGTHKQGLLPVGQPDERIWLSGCIRAKERDAASPTWSLLASGATHSQRQVRLHQLPLRAQRHARRHHRRLRLSQLRYRFSTSEVIEERIVEPAIMTFRFAWCMYQLTI